MLNNSLFKKALLLEYLTIGWNILEGLSSILVGTMTGSVALVAYGLESGVEVFASAVVLWDLKGLDKGREKKALKMIGYAYLVVSVYIFFDALINLLQKHHPDKSYLGVILMFITFLVMFALGIGKKNVGQKLKSFTVLADAKFTLIDALLAAAVLIGLLFNAFFGWWWMDGTLALFLAAVAFQEGIKEILRK